MKTASILLALGLGLSAAAAAGGAEPTTKPMNNANQIDYIEFSASDLPGTKAFFEQVFGWKFTDYGPDYSSFEDGRITGGFFRSDKRASLVTGTALVVIFHPRLEEIRQRVLDHGGKITRDIFSFPGGRRFHFTEPSGNELAVWSDH